MKSKFTTSLALVAVLLTGTAAAAINTQALNGPTESTISTGATTLLPTTDSVAMIPGQTEITTVAPSQSAAGGQTQAPVTATSPTQKSVSPTPAITSPATKTSTMVFANPNPTTGEDEDDDENEDEDDDEDEDDEDDD